MLPATDGSGPPPTDRPCAGACSSASAHENTRIDLLPVVIYAPPWARADLSQGTSPPANDSD
jgi:hypothetical protein